MLVSSMRFGPDVLKAEYLSVAANNLIRATYADLLFCEREFVGSVFMCRR